MAHIRRVRYLTLIGFLQPSRTAYIRPVRSTIRKQLPRAAPQGLIHRLSAMICEEAYARGAGKKSAPDALHRKLSPFATFPQSPQPPPSNTLSTIDTNKNLHVKRSKHHPTFSIAKEFPQTSLHGNPNIPHEESPIAAQRLWCLSDAPLCNQPSTLVS